MSPSKLKVVYQHGPSPSWTHQDKASHEDLFRQDQARVDYIHRLAANPTTRLNLVGGSLFAGVPAIVDHSLGIFNHVIKIGLGTPTKYFTVMLDTGSDLTWTQCVPCINCYNQNNPFYDPTQSSTFTTIECISDYCTQLYRFHYSSTFTCLYEQTYANNCFTKGSIVNDTLKFYNDYIKNFHFGCGDNNTRYFGHVDGLLGLGRGPLSFISQTSQFYNNIFAYCLPSGPNKVGYLELGSPALGVTYTPMLTNPNFPSFYFLNLTAIFVGGEKLDLSPTIFNSPRTMLDSGAVFSRLPQTAYFALRSSFRKRMSNYLMAPPLFGLDTCYNLTNIQQVELPEIYFVYEGEVITNLDRSGILFEFSKFQSCLSFIGNRDDSQQVIIGNMQQRRFNIVYDKGNLQIGFEANGCS